MTVKRVDAIEDYVPEWPKPPMQTERWYELPLGTSARDVKRLQEALNQGKRLLIL